MKIIFSLAFSFFLLTATAQPGGFPNNPAQGSDKTNNVFRGGVTAQYGFGNVYFNDTTSANLNPYIKFIPGWQIIVNDTLHVRNSTATKWVKQGGGGGTSASDSALIFKTVTSIATSSRTDINQIIVTDTIRGGQFYRYTGTDAADNGMIFADATGQKWLRQTEGRKVSVAWYGAKSDYSVDCSPLFEAARDYVYAHKNKYNTLYVPFSYNPATYNRYVFTRELKFTQQIRFEGEDGNEPVLYFPANMRGVFFQQYVSDYRASMKNFKLENGWVPYNDRDSSRALVTVRCRMIMSNVQVLFATGPCLEVRAWGGGDSTTNQYVGQTSFSSFTNCEFQQGYHGIFIEGDESNAMTFLNCATQANVRWGVLDDGFLGNKFLNCSFQGNSNAALSGAKSTVSYLGKYYQATPAHDDGSGIGKQPDLFPDYWNETGPRASFAWDNLTRYKSGGSYYVKNANATSRFLEPYIEGDDGPYWLNSRSISDGGVDGVGYGHGGMRAVSTVDGYSMLGTINLPETKISEAPHRLQVNSNVQDFGTITLFKNKTGINRISTFEGYNFFAINRYKNTAEPDAYYGTIYNDFVWGMSSTNIAYLGLANFRPATTNTVDLGTTTERWKNVYAGAYYGSGANLTSIPQSAVTGLPADLLSLFRKSAYYNVVGTDANITAAAGTVYHLPAATLSANRTINVSALTTENDYIEILNNEAGFTWSFTGATVYLVDRTTTVTNLVTDAHYKIRLINGKLIIL